uniref:Fibronectin type III and SPRY domain containing 2 n=1 Tax=Varanus komodoensis TaxID=61221 RepID=A0A8D2LUE4_VARKO
MATLLFPPSLHIYPQGYTVIPLRVLKIFLMMEPLSEERQTGSPRFYHLELYDSCEDFEIFSEEPFRRRDLAVESRRAQSAEKQAIPDMDSKDQPLGDARGGGEKAHGASEAITDYDKNPLKDTDMYCITCCVPVRALDKHCREHEEHEVMPLASVVEIAKDAFQKNICKLEEQIAHLESFSSHLEEIFITVEEDFARQEQNFEKHYSDLMQTLEQRYEENMQALGEEKKEKLEALYEQLVSCGENLDTCKELTETIEDLDQRENKVDVIKVRSSIVQIIMDEILGTFLEKDVEVDLSMPTDFKARTINVSDIQELMDSVDALPGSLPPCAPVMNSQDPSSATGTSVRVCWSFFSEDLVESYQLYYKRPPRSSAPGRLPSSPLPPVIKRKELQSCEHAALVRWECGNTNPVDSYTAELSRLTDGEDGDMITETIVGIPNCETLIPLEPRHHYLISVRAVNMGGAQRKERSGPLCLLTGTAFTLNEETSHPSLLVLEDGLTIMCHKAETSRNDLSFSENSFTRSIAILGNPIPFRGKHYWEVDVSESVEYSVGVALENVPRDSCLGTSHSSWCMRHTVTLSRHTYEFLNDGRTPDIKITVSPQRIGLLLDYDQGTLSFFNTDIMQHLYTFHGRFQDFVCPCFALGEPGRLRIQNGIALPAYANFY